jgi:hypothetical protein
VIFLFNKNLDKKIDALNENFEKANIHELTYILGSKREIIKRNFLAGIIRGVGIGIGFTIITAIILIILQRIVTLNIPIIGEYIADIIDIIEKAR